MVREEKGGEVEKSKKIGYLKRKLRKMKADKNVAAGHWQQVSGTK